MEREVYIDLYFLINVSMDLLSLMITAALLHRRISRWRAWLAALLGGLYAAAALLLGLDGALGFALDAILSLLMCAAVFASRRCGFARILKATALLVLVSMTLGGVMTALYSWLNRLDLPWDAMERDGPSVWVFALLTAVAGFTTLRGGKWFGLTQKTKSVTLDLTLFGERLELCAMVDSGNLLRDPVSGKGVIIVDPAHLDAHLPPEILRACQSGDPALWPTSHEYARRIRPIPAQSVCGSALLLALVPDKLTLTVGSESYPADYLIAAAPLGDRAMGFDAIIALD